MGLWDFINLLETQCYNCANISTYQMYLDEIKIRQIESISEGGSYKLKKLAKTLHEEFNKEVSKDKSFATANEREEFKYIIENEI
jgi:hypothetical protein